ncbi:MAG: hypothetical protein RRZ24_06040, partial [Clostridia bacterium]
TQRKQTLPWLTKKVSRITGSSSAPDRGNVWLGNPIQIRLHEVAHVDLIIHKKMCKFVVRCRYRQQKLNYL